MTLHKLPSPTEPESASRGRAVALWFAIAFGTAAGIGKLPAQEAAASARAEEQPVTLDAFVVSGIRSSLTKALEVKRESVGLVDAIAAEDIGKFPDNNLVEALQRVPGIQVTNRGSGEVATVSIRGLNDINTTLHGQNIFTASGTSFALQDIAPSLLSRVEVYKTRTADLIENGIAGALNIQMHRPFDFPGRKVILAARASYADLADRYGSNVSGLVSDVWETKAGKIGAMINVSNIVIPYENHRAVAGAQVPYFTDQPPAGFAPYQRVGLTLPGVAEDPIWEPGLENGIPSAAGSTFDINGQPTPYVLSRDAVFHNEYTGTRRRPSANLTLQWAPSDAAEYTFETFYAGYRETSLNNWLFTFMDSHEAPVGEVELFPGTNIVKSRAVNSPYMWTSGDAIESKTDTYFYSLSGKWQLGRALTVNSTLTYQESEYNNQFFAVRADRVAPSVNVDLNPGNGVPHFTFPDDQADPRLWNVAQLYDNAGRNKGDAVTWTADATYTTGWNFLTRVKFGVRYDDRKASEAYRTQDAAAAVLGEPLSNFPDLQLVNEGFFRDGLAGPASWVVPNATAIFAEADKYRAIWKAKNPAYQLAEDLFLLENFNVNEQNRAAYAMGELDTLGGRLKGNIGVRFVSVKTDMTFTDRGTLETESASTSTDKLLPSGALRYELLDDVYIRAAYSQTLRRPSFSSLNPAIMYWADVTNVGYGTANGGNPNLRPTESNNYDLSLEYYFAPSSVVYATLFRREIDGLVVNFRKRVSYQGEDYILSQPDNTSDGELQGVELGFTYFPSNLPSVLQGLGLQASYTALDSEQTIPMTNAAGDVTGSLRRQFFQVSKHSYNVSLAYERKKFSARLSYSWRSAFLNSYEAARFASPLGFFRQPERSLDCQIAYRILPNLELTLDGTNLTNEMYQDHYGEDGALTNNFSSNLYSRYFSVGARYSF